MTKTLSVLMPVFNEEKTIHEILDRISAVEMEDLCYEIVIVDDGSTDGSARLIEIYIKENSDKNIHFHKQEKNMGKGSAISKCLEIATGDILLIQDADLEYDPRDYPKLLEPILDGRGQVVFGSRFLGGPHRVLFFWHYCANKFLTLLSNILNNLNVSDMETCYKVFTRQVADQLTITSKRFGMEPEFAAKVAKMKVPIYEVPISYSGRDYSEGKKIGVWDGLAAFWWVFRYRFF